MIRLNRCPDTQRLLSAYVEGELGEVEISRVQSHLAQCESCRREERQFRTALGALRSAPPAQVPVDLYSGFALKLAQQPSQPSRRHAQFRLAGATACLLLIVSAGATMWHATQEANSNRKHGQGVAAIRHNAPATTKLAARNLEAMKTEGLRHSADFDDGFNPSNGENHNRQDANGTLEKRDHKSGVAVFGKPQEGRKNVASADSLRTHPRYVVVTNHAIHAKSHPRYRQVASSDAKADLFAGMTPVTNEKIQIGDRQTTIQSASGVDPKGRTLLYVNINTSEESVQE